MKFKLTSDTVAAAFEFAAMLGATVLTSQLIWSIAVSAVDRVA